MFVPDILVNINNFLYDIFDNIVGRFCHYIEIVLFILICLIVETFIIPIYKSICSKNLVNPYTNMKYGFNENINWFKSIH